MTQANSPWGTPQPLNPSPHLLAKGGLYCLGLTLPELFMIYFMFWPGTLSLWLLLPHRWGYEWWPFGTSSALTLRSIPSSPEGLWCTENYHFEQM